uniref:C6 domain-containing protein n=1 Tax=Panagrolaimus davidi TaxID=227884 RepID=A0A914PP19_9BILA
MAINECPSAFALPDIKKCRGCRRCKTTDIMIQGENHPSINRYVTNDDCSILVATCMQKGSAVLKFNEGGPIDGKYFPEAASNEPKRVIFDCEEEGWVFKSSDSINAKVTKLECIEAKLENHNSCNDCKSENLRAPGINSIYVTTILGYDGCLMALFQCPPNENVNKESGVYGRVFQSPSTEVTLKCLNQKWMHGTAEIHDLACTTPNV